MRVKDITAHGATAIAVLVVGLALRLINLTAGGLWLDEIWSMQTSASDQTIRGIIAACVQDTHPPLFDLILHGWLVLFGDSDLSGRSLALFFGVVGMTLTWGYTLKITSNRSTALVALALVAFNYFHIYYSNEVRFYGFIYVLAVVIIGQFYLYLKNASLQNLIGFAGAAILLLYTHYYGLFLMAGIGVATLLLRVQRGITPAQFWRIFLSAIGVLLAFVPWIPVVLRGGTSESWMQPPAWYHFIEYFYAYTGKNPVEVLLILGLFIVGLGFIRRFRILLTLLYTVVLVGFFAPYLASHLVVPMLHERYTMIYFPAILLIVALVFTALPRIGWNGRAAVLLMVWISVAVNFGFVHPYFQERQKEPWRAVAEELQKENKAIQAPVYSEMHFWLNYYLNQYELEPAMTIPRDHVQSMFWAVITPYDSAPFSNQDPTSFEVLKQVEFRNGFVLLLVQKPN